ncbi:hypothetical protein IKG20_02820, partial [Candidatus Saccharibacteria bacterium]|nr:hypothetical protein [Candidatus Saccharibacteria bacterium]
TIDGNVNAAFNEIVIKGKVSISGTFKYNNTANITGMENLSAGSTETYVSETREVSFATSLKSKLISLLGRLLVTIVFIAIAGKFTKRLITEFNLKSSWKYLGLGLALLIGVPLAAVFVMVTIIGLPLGLIGVGAYILFAYIATSVTGLIVGDKLAKHLFKKEKMHPFLKATIGITLLTLLGLIPYVGSLIGAISACFGFGYLVRKIFRQPKAAKK